MINRLKMFVIAGLILCGSINAEDKKPDPETEIIPKLIKLKVKKICKTRKVKYKGSDVGHTGGHKTNADRMDLRKDDKIDYITITVDIENKNMLSINNYKLVTHVYGKSVADKNKDPEMLKEFTENIVEIKTKEKYKKEFEHQTRYDRSADVMREAERVGDATFYNKVAEIPAFGERFYGYKVELINDKGEIIASEIYPSRLKKILKAENKK